MARHLIHSNGILFVIIAIFNMAFLRKQEKNNKINTWNLKIHFTTQYQYYESRLCVYTTILPQSQLSFRLVDIEPRLPPMSCHTCNLCRTFEGQDVWVVVSFWKTLKFRLNLCWLSKIPEKWFMRNMCTITLFQSMTHCDLKCTLRYVNVNDLTH